VPRPLLSLLLSPIPVEWAVAENSSDDSELIAIGEAIEAYELKRWPEGKEPGGKG
jgi:hypothetical protein